ncbi:hypothetical protein R3P38DRAFT_2889760 [Favolaschia claudopus]|uniref:HIT-type domain-containing protein n=1 Tax=Favolaschia claudopus TaxID=2862362 RepID=A0AAW0CT63_9AGAR
MSSPETVTCGLCRRQFSKYTCPTCNVPYCSLTCFRSSAHSQCSETFYKKEVESDIRAEPSKSASERQRMLQLLKRFEEESSTQDELNSEDEDEESDLARRFRNVDMESTSPDQLWTLLTADEREKFLKAMENPSSELALQLLASEELSVEKQEPWWSAAASGISSAQHETIPDPIEIPTSLASLNRPGPPLIYNICAVLIAYAYTIRHLSVLTLSGAAEPDAEAARAIFASLTPFLTSRTSKTLHSSLESALTDLHSRLPADSATPQLLALLLRDAASLLRPSLVVDAESHPHIQTLRAFGDMYALFPTRVHVAHKITFYAAFVVSSPTVRIAAAELEREVAMREVQSQADKVAWERVQQPKDQEKASKVKIVELDSK